MSRFLKLTGIIINKNYIQHIDVQKQDKFFIHLMSNKIDGIFLFTAGNINSYNNIIEVCKTKHLSDYKIVDDWINNELK